MAVRALIVLLLILNLGVALWWVARTEVQPAPVAPLPEGAEPIRLLREEAAPSLPASAAGPVPEAAAQGPVPLAAPVPPDAAAQPVTGASRCRSFGPFADADAAAQAQARLAPLARSTTVRQVQPGARGWQVLMRGLPDREAAAATSSRLVAAGFRDQYLMPTAPDGTVDVALGRFGSEAAAQRHRQALLAAGFEAVAEPLGDPAATRYWIDATFAAEADLDALQRASGAARSEPAECAAAAAR